MSTELQMVTVLSWIDVSIVTPALRMLPPAMNTPPARAQLLAIGLQESRFLHRRQINGPARGFWQFEWNGCKAVLSHDGVAPSARAVCAALDVRHEPGQVYAAIEHHDVLAAAFARLLLRASPKPLAPRDEPEKGWALYIDAWRPGKPHRQTWDAFYDLAWEAVVQVLT